MYFFITRWSPMEQVSEVTTQDGLLDSSKI
jgi:hypothetical protein